MNKNIGRKLAEGVSSRLEFDYACQRGHSFGEYYLHGVMNEIISANIDPVAAVPHAGYAHLALARPDSSVSGRKPEVDFYIKPRIDGGPTVCIEAKWAGSSHCSWDKVLLDLCRLTLVSDYSSETVCYFVLAGQTLEIEKILRSLREKLSPTKEGKAILQTPAVEHASRQRSFSLVDWGNRSILPAKIQDSLPRLPDKIRTTLLIPGTYTPRFQSIVWRVE